MLPRSIRNRPSWVVTGTAVKAGTSPFSGVPNIKLLPTHTKPKEVPDIGFANSGMTVSIPVAIEQTLLGALARIRYAAVMRETTDEKLMQRYAKGEAQAFDRLYARHRGPLYRYLKRQVSDAAVANDLYQGVWEKIIKSRRKYRPTAPFKAWMYRIAHNHLVDHYRRRQPVEPLQQDTAADTQTNLTQALIDDEHRQQLKAGILSLSPDQRDTLLLKLESGLKLEDIARVTGVSRETVKSRLRYAVKKLKQVLIE